MDLYHLGKVPWEDSQLLYHALAELGREALCLLSPSAPYVCIGFHQDASHEVDLEYCAARHIPVFRRDLGGGAVYLDGEQLFFQLILHRDNPLAPRRKEAFYETFLAPVIAVYRRLGIPARFKPVNDVVVGGKKISGTGAAEIGDCIVFVGNLIRDFNFTEMTRVLKVPDEKFRDKIHSTLIENLTTIKREMCETQASGWSAAALNQLMITEFGRILGPFTPGPMDARLAEMKDKLGRKMCTDQWLHRKGGKHPGGRDVKICSGTRVKHRIYKAPGGLIRADMEIKADRFGAVSLSGDFFCFPKSAIGGLESWLEGKPVAQTANWVKEFYMTHDIETPGIAVEDWTAVLAGKPGSGIENASAA